MIINQSIRDMVQEIIMHDLEPNQFAEIVIKLLNELYRNSQLPAVKARYKQYYANTYAIENPEAQIAKYPLDEQGYAHAFDPLYEEQAFWDAWVKYGVVVSKNNLSTTEANKAISRIGEIVAAISEQRFDISDPSTYANIPVDANKTPFISRGFLEVYHDDMLAQLRQSIRLYIHNVVIWGRVDLWTTFDRLGVKLPEHPDAKGLPLHVDQNPLVHPKFTTVQGVLAFVDCPAERGTLVVVPGSRALFKKYSDVVVKSDPNYKGEYVQLDLEQPFAKALESGYQVLPLRMGCYASWDSRTTHANTANISDKPRYVAYVSARPANEHMQAAVQARDEAFKTGLGSNFRDAAMHASKKPRFTMQELLQSVRKPEKLNLLGELMYGKRSYWPILQKRSNLKLLMNAEAFGYGPAAAMADFYRALRSKFTYIAVIGSKHTLDLVPPSCNAFYDMERLEPNVTVDDILRSHDVFFTALDFKMAERAVALNVQTIIYDSLTWYWRNIPEVVQNPNVLYIAQDFLGVRARIKDNPKQFGNPFIISPVTTAVTTDHAAVEKDIILLNFGGLSNDFSSEDVLKTYTQLIYNIVKNLIPEGYTLIVAGNPKLTEAVGGKSYSRDEMRKLLPRVKLAFITSGLGNIFESALHDIPTICLPEANDSQGIQAKLLRDHDKVDAVVSWHDLDIAIDYEQSQNYIMSRINSAILTAADDAAVHSKLKTRLQQAFSQLIQQSHSKGASLVEQFGTDGVTKAVNAIQAFCAYNFGSQHLTEYYRLAGGISLVLNFRTHVDTLNDQTLLQARVPGLEWGVSSSSIKRLVINPSPNEDLSNLPESQICRITNLDEQGLSGDAPHLIYAMARKAWLNQHMYAVHAACVGSPETGYVLIVGHPGAGKSSTALELAVRQGWKLFSGDTTLVQFGKDFDLEAIGGTKVMTLRKPDRTRWPDISDEQGRIINDRFVFGLTPDQYSLNNSVKIKAVVLLNLNDTRSVYKRLEAASALHTLYPYFLDSERADVILQDGGFYDGSVSTTVRTRLIAYLKLVLQTLPVYDIQGSMASVTQNISTLLAPRIGLFNQYQTVRNNDKQVLFGVCGLGNGHTFRQLPLIQHLLADGYKIIIFAYGNSLAHFNKIFAGNPKVNIFPVHNDFIVGDTEGVSFELSAKHANNLQDSHGVNLQAMANADKLGTIDCVISDLEYVSAQYARARGIKQITVDQQSKFFLPGFPKFIKSFNYKDEIERLRMFFPDSHMRIALSFFKPKETGLRPETPVMLLPPILRPEILSAKDLQLFDKRTIMIYMSSMYQKDINLLQELSMRYLDTNFVVYMPAQEVMPEDCGNVRFKPYGDASYIEVFSRCHGIIATAGHSLLSEAMYLQKPVLALPANIYEQQLNAKVIGDNAFGINCDGELTLEILQSFILQLAQFRSNIQRDVGKILLPGTDSSSLIRIIKSITEHMEVSSRDDRTWTATSYPRPGFAFT